VRSVSHPLRLGLWDAGGFGGGRWVTVPAALWVTVAALQGLGVCHCRGHPGDRGLQEGFPQPHVPQTPARTSAAPVLHLGPSSALHSPPLPPLSSPLGCLSPSSPAAPVLHLGPSSALHSPPLPPLSSPLSCLSPSSPAVSTSPPPPPPAPCFGGAVADAEHPPPPRH